MLGQPVQWQHVGILARSYIRYAVRSGSGLVFLIIFLIVGLAIAGFIVDPMKKLYERQERELEEHLVRMAEQQKLTTEELKQQLKKEMTKTLANEVRPILAWWVGSEENQEPRPSRQARGQPVPAPAPLNNKPKDPFLDYLVVEQPPILSVFMLILLAFVPYTVCLGAFNQFSGDIGTRGLRYLLLRTERINIFLARFIATVTFTTVTTLGMMLVVILYMYMAFRTDSLPNLLAWGARGWLTTLIISLPYVCLCTWMSAMIDSPFVTLVLCYLLVGGPVLLLKFATGTLAKVLQVENMNWLERLTPWGWKYELLHPDTMQVSQAASVALAYSLVLFCLALRHFLKRDL